ncbi:MAG: succinate-semialdehyde dehydrogenase [bacterium TMED161]|nr:succinate-semialdehyde dehydrogenase [Candidatus Neomarinimicrobiota bacterium]OUW20993.1 MAG: succinate-semialdehyde dehydrogenase [bacterium TMED161]|tara:strand:- start:802 stop:2169 length:1368 start_codon:yes stop_codon:yes gene_type:complete
MSVLKSINPVNEQAFAEFQEFSLSKVKKVILESSKAQEEWAELNIKNRINIISEVKKMILENKKQYAEIITMEMGKPILESIAEIEKCALLCEYYEKNSEEFLKDKYLKSNAVTSFVSYKPLGVIFGIMPWNFPFWQVFRFVVPAIISGNSTLVKHAPNVQSSAIAIEKIFHSVGLPKDIFRILIIDIDIVPDIISNKMIKAVSLTGSEVAGSKVAECSGKNLKKTVLELGSTDAFIVLDDADLPKCVDSAIKGRMLNNGQSCIAAKRFILHDDIYNDFLEMLKNSVSSLKLGDPMLNSTQVGPLARFDILDKIQSQVDQSIELGANLVCGGKKVGTLGYFYAPTILTNITKDMPVYNQETFGPVFSVFKCSNIKQMLDLANDTDFGLGASVWSNDNDKALSIAHKIETGAVFINDFMKSDPRFPFGGVKKSGYGRELSEFGIKEFVNVKTIAVF